MTPKSIHNRKRIDGYDWTSNTDSMNKKVRQKSIHLASCTTTISVYVKYIKYRSAFVPRILGKRMQRYNFFYNWPNFKWEKCQNKSIFHPSVDQCQDVCGDLSFILSLFSLKQQKCYCSMENETVLLPLFCGTMVIIIVSSGRADSAISGHSIKQGFPE